METINQVDQLVPTTSQPNDDSLLEAKKIELDLENKSCEEFFETPQTLSDIEEDDEIEDEDEETFYDFNQVDIVEALLEPIAPQVPEPISVNEQPSNGLDTIDRLIEQRRNELALELRRLQFSDISPNRNRLENWLSRNIQSASASPGNSQQHQVYRSTNIQNEISQLGSIRPVSNVLSTSRARIERVLSNMLQNNRPTNNPVQTQRLAPPPPPPAPMPAPAPAPQRQQRNIQPWLVRQTANTVEEISREQIISEISELVHRQLVSNSLQSDFRTVLERRVMDRLRRIGTDGAQTREFIRNLPIDPSIQRNDFSHLGLNLNNQVNDQNDIPDSASSISENRAHRRIVNNSREIKELKSEIKELKSMLKLSFELQMDMQKSLKQEISALINGTFQNTASASLIRTARPLEGGKCVICTEQESDTVFYECGHICACYLCSMNLKQKNHNCPVCRAPIKDILRTYKCGLD